SVAVAFGQVTIALHTPGLVPWVSGAGHVITGGVVSVTVTVNVQVPVLADVSVAEQLTVVTPLLNVDPLAGLQVTVRGPSQLSVAVGCVYVTTAVQALDAALALTLLQPHNTGATLSVTVTVNVQVAGLPDVSEAEQLTVVTPLGNTDPAVGLQTTVLAPSQLSVAVGCV